MTIIEQAVVTMEQAATEIKCLREEKKLLLTLLRHAVQRNHEHSPGLCTPCERIEQKLLEE